MDYCAVLQSAEAYWLAVFVAQENPPGSSSIFEPYINLHRLLYRICKWRVTSFFVYLENKNVCVVWSNAEIHKLPDLPVFQEDLNAAYICGCVLNWHCEKSPKPLCASLHLWRKPFESKNHKIYVAELKNVHKWWVFIHCKRVLLSFN